MQTMSAGFRSIELILDLHGDKLIYLAAIAGGLLIGAAIGTQLLPVG